MESEYAFMLVDDEPLVRRSIWRRPWFAQVLMWTWPRMQSPAWRCSRQHNEAGDPFGLAILDLHNPNLEGDDDPDAGLKLLSALSAIQPGISGDCVDGFRRGDPFQRGPDTGSERLFR